MCMCGSNSTNEEENNNNNKRNDEKNHDNLLKLHQKEKHIGTLYNVHPFVGSAVVILFLLNFFIQVLFIVCINRNFRAYSLIYLHIGSFRKMNKIQSDAFSLSFLQLLNRMRETRAEKNTQIMAQWIQPDIILYSQAIIQQTSNRCVCVCLCVY